MRDDGGIFHYGEIMETGNSMHGHKIGFTPTPYEMIFKQVADRLAADNEHKFHKALIELGWTPPAEHKEKDDNE